MTKQTALITGASGGIGLEFAKHFAKNGYNLILVARSGDKLQQLANELKQQHQTETLVIAQDLTDPNSPQAVFDAVQKAGLTVDVLINNAGYATYGKFHELDLQKELDMIQLNVRTLVHLTHLFVQGMVARKNGKIMNVASTAAYFPGPLMANYYATKAYVLSFSEAIGNELSGTGVTVTVLCPGPTESGFQSRANMTDSKLVQGGLMDVQSVVEAGYKGLMAGKSVVVPGMKNQINILSPRFLPRRIVTGIVRNAQERTGH